MRYKKILIRAIWVILPFVVIGVVMTVNGGDVHHSQQGSLSEHNDITRLAMNRIQLGNSGLSLSSPEDFDLLTASAAISPSSAENNSEVVFSEYFQYEKNGVNIKIDYLTYANDARLTLEDIRTHYLVDLNRLQDESAVKYSVNNIQRSGIDGFIVEAEYPVQFLDKHVRFDVLTFVKSNRLWRVTAKYKDCDQKGQVLVRWMLESIRILS